MTTIEAAILSDDILSVEKIREDNRDHHADRYQTQLLTDVENRVTVAKLLTALDARAEHVVRRAFGIDCDRETQQEIAQGLGVSQPRVKQILDAALIRLRSLA